MAYYFIKGRVMGRPGDSHDFYDVFQSTETPKIAFDNYLLAKKTKRSRTPKDIDIFKFNKVD